MLALKIVMYILNQVSSKAIPKTSFELWTRRKPSLNHLNVWGCPMEVRIYNPHERKLDSRTTNSSLVVQKNLKGVNSIFPNHSKRIVEARNAKFIKNSNIIGSMKP